MAKKIRRAILILILAFILIYFLIMPIINWNRTYDISNINTPEKAIEYYCDSIKERNPKKSLAIYPSLKEYDDRPRMFSYVDIVHNKLNDIEEAPNDYEYSEELNENEKLYYVDNEILTFLEWLEVTGGSSQWTFKVAKNNENGSWYIEDIYHTA